MSEQQALLTPEQEVEIREVMELDPVLNHLSPVEYAKAKGYLTIVEDAPEQQAPAETPVTPENTETPVIEPEVEFEEEQDEEEEASVFQTKKGTKVSFKDESEAKGYIKDKLGIDVTTPAGYAKLVEAFNKQRTNAQKATELEKYKDDIETAFAEMPPEIVKAIEAYNNGNDVHALTARLLLDKAADAVISSDERRLGKTINFGVIYGMGAQRFARETGVGQAEAKEFLTKYKQRYQKVFTFLELQERLALSRGYVETILARRRIFNFDPNGLGRLKGKDPMEINLELARRGGMEAQQLRAAANAPIQGSSADIIKLAMVQLNQKLAATGLPARLLLQVHDELVLECDPLAQKEVMALVKNTMEQAVSLSVPLLVEIGAGPNWMEAK